MGVILRDLLEKYKQKIQQVRIYNRLEFKKHFTHLTEEFFHDTRSPLSV